MLHHVAWFVCMIYIYIYIYIYTDYLVWQQIRIYEGNKRSRLDKQDSLELLAVHHNAAEASSRPGQHLPNRLQQTAPFMDWLLGWLGWLVGQVNNMKSHAFKLIAHLILASASCILQ